LGNDLLVNPLEPQASHIALPNGPGLGIEFDEKQLADIIHHRRRVE
jgi:L-alanine-DL-glutamate epimerase-like enolase superfamily enzyme